ncbi:DUF6436 domain-containing protein [Alteromonas sp. CI.11.F.A3]|uniref:DUF6436 domain-containing protein n=1 Tax=Alteromonas sp. CI.11.F.A3 TaxID=3079555 RepID=UPI0029429379|nr:DUF6436 domain-containing protein [Alteromonas sp. CI.11.F.A3]WOI37390.1 DUF6436 domain-containing protein [Alteromonas sp. CI.11.F.A3]
MSKKGSWTLLLVWAISLLSAVLFYSQRQISEFDPKGTLLHQSTSVTFDASLITLLKNYDVPAGSIVHVGTQENCYCDTLTDPHQTQLINKLGQLDYSGFRLDIENVPELAAILPSVPALMVVDTQYNLRYLGPYATGYGCFTGKNLVDEISGYASNSSYINAVVKTEADGCFCNSHR